MKKQFKLLCATLCSFATLGLASMDARAQTYCSIPNYVDNTWEWITNVTFAGINQSSGANANSYGNYTTGTVGNVTIGAAQTLSVTIEYDGDEHIYAFFDWNQNGSFTDPGERYTVASAVNTSGPHTLSIVPPATALTGNTRMRITLDYDNLSAGDPCMVDPSGWDEIYGEAEDYTINVQASTAPPVTSIAVATQGGVPATITTNAGTLQMTATVLPATAIQTVTWSIVPGTGTATISSTGLVTAQTNGTVWAKAVSTADATKKDSLQITVSNQAYCTIPNYVDNTWEWITNVTFAGINQSSGANANSYGDYTTGTVGNVTIGTAQTLSVTIEYDGDEYINAFFDWNQNGSFTDPGERYTVASAVNTSGPHTLSITPPATALTGNTRMRITLDYDNLSAGDPCMVDPSGWDEIYGEAEDYTINVQGPSTPVVASVAVATQGGAPATITTNAGTLQMTAAVLPANAPQTVTWSIVPGTGAATISATGLVTAQSNGTVWAKAVSTADASKKDSLQITLSNQAVPVNSVAVATQGGAPATISTNAGTLQMTATVLPANAPQTVTWSIVPGTGTATISAAGLVTAQTNGTVWAKAVSTADASKQDSLQILISNQGTGVNDLFTSGGVAVYPNPVNNELYIDFKSWTAEVFTVSMTNLLGQEVYKATLNNKKTAHNITKFAPGTYILSITDAKGNRSGIKINKQ